MRRLIVATVLTLSTVVIAGPVITPATSVAVSIVRLLADFGSGKQEYIQVDIISEGDTEDQARSEGFRTAVIKAVGSVVATQTESQNQRLARDEIISYSSGYVDRYEVLEQSAINNRTRLKMRVWVAHSKLAKRLINQGFSLQVVPGAQLAAQAQTLLDERQRGDQLVATVLKDYPTRAFTVATDQGRLNTHGGRSFVFEVPVTINWNENFVIALNEALTVTNDRAKPYMVYSSISSVYPTVRARAMDAGGNVLAHACVPFAVVPEQASNRSYQYFLTMPGERLQFNKRYSVSGVLELKFYQNHEIIRQIAQIRVEIISGTNCL